MTNPFDTAVPLTDQGSASSNPFDQAVPVGPQRAQNVQSNDVGTARFGTQYGTSRQPQAASQPSLISRAGDAATSFAMGAGAPLYSLTGQLASGFGMFPNRFAQGQSDIANQANQYRQELGNQGGVSGFANNLVGQAGQMSTFMPLAYAAGVPALEAGAAPYLGSLGTSALVRGGIGGLMATPLMTAMNPTDPNKSFGQSVAENVPSMMGQMALMSGGLGAIGEIPNATKAGAEATARLFRGTKNIKLAPEVLHGESVPDVMNAARMDSDLVGNQTMNDIQQISQMDGIEGAKARTVMQRLTAATASDHNVELSLGDLSGDPNLRAKEQALESKPGSGMNEFRERQGQEVRRAVVDLGRQKDAEAAFNPDGSHRQFDFENPDPTVAPSLMDQVQKDAASRTAGDIGANPTQAERLVGNIADMRRSLLAGDNTNPKAIQLSLQGQEWQNRQIANQKYGEIGDAIGSALKADPTLPKIVDVTPVQRSIQNLIDQNETSPAYDKELAAKLTTWDSNLSRDGVNLSYPSVKQSISQMEGTIADLEASGNTNLARQLRGVKGHLDLQAENYAKQVLAGRPEDLQLIGDADQFYKKNVVPYSDPDTGIGDIARGMDADKAVRPFFTEQSPDQFNRMFNLLDERGKAAVRAEMVGRTEDAASRMKNFQDINLPSFARYLENRSDQVNTAYGDDTSLPGLAHLIRNTPRAGYQSKLENLFGMNNVGGGVAKMAMGGLGALGGSVAGPGGSLGGAMLGYGAEPAMEAGINRFVGSELISPTLSKYIDPSIRLDQYGLKLQPTPIEQPPVSGLQDINANRAAREAHYAKIGNPAAYESPAGPGGQNGLVGPLGRSLEGQPVNYGPDSPNPRPMPYTAPKGELGAPSLAPQPRSLGAGGQPSASLTAAFEPPTPNPQFTMQARAGEGYADPYANLKAAQDAHAAAQGETAFSRDNLGNAIAQKRDLTNQTTQAKTDARAAFEASGGTRPTGWSQVDRDYQHQAFDQNGNVVESYDPNELPPADLMAGTSTKEDRAFMRDVMAGAKHPGQRGNVVREPNPDEMLNVADRIGNWMDYLQKRGISGKEEVLLPNNVPPQHIARSNDPFAAMPHEFHPGTIPELQAEYNGMAATKANIEDFAQRTRQGEFPQQSSQSLALINDLSAKTSRVRDLQQQLKDMANSPINTKSLTDELTQAQAVEFEAFQNVRRNALNQRQPAPANNPATAIPTQSLTAPFAEPGGGVISNPRTLPGQPNTMTEPYAQPQSGTGLSSFGEGSVGAGRSDLNAGQNRLDQAMAELRARQAKQNAPIPSLAEAQRTFESVQNDLGETPTQKAAKELAQAQEQMRQTGIKADEAAKQLAARRLNEGLAETPPQSPYDKPEQAMPVDPQGPLAKLKAWAQVHGFLPAEPAPMAPQPTTLPHNRPLPEPEGNPQLHTLATAKGSLDELMSNLSSLQQQQPPQFQGPYRNPIYAAQHPLPTRIELSNEPIDTTTGKPAESNIDELARQLEIERPDLIDLRDAKIGFGNAEPKEPSAQEVFESGNKALKQMGAEPSSVPSLAGSSTDKGFAMSAYQDYVQQTTAKQLEYQKQLADAKQLGASADQIRQMQIDQNKHLGDRKAAAQKMLPFIKKGDDVGFNTIWQGRP